MVAQRSVATEPQDECLVLPHVGALVAGDAGFFTGFILAALSALPGVV